MDSHACTFRSDLGQLAFVSQDEEHCDVELRLQNGITHFCTRPAGHPEEHYSFSDDYGIVWPFAPTVETEPPPKPNP